MANPWLTSDDLIASIQRKIAFPISQNTFSNDDILAFVNEEMYISQVPSVLTYHEEFFVTYEVVPLTTGINRYPIPNRAIGMRLRDIKWQDNAGNMFDMTRVSPDDKAFFQRNIGANQAVHKYYVEGNDIVLLPAVTADPTGQFVMSFYIRPNQLVTNDQAAIIQYFSQDITVNSSVMNPGDVFNIQLVQTVSVLPAVGNPPYQSYLPGSYEVYTTPIATLTAVPSSSVSITSITSPQTGTVQITADNHYLTLGQTVVISGSDSTPSIDGTYQVINIVDNDNFQIAATITGNGSSGSFTSPNQFLIDSGSSVTTTSNFVIALNALTGIINNATNGNSSTDVAHIQYSNVSYSFTTNNSKAFSIPTLNTNGIVTGTQGIDFVSIPSGVYANGNLIDFLQTNPGHRIFNWDIPIVSISGNTIYFNAVDIPVPNAYNGIGLSVGDYICPANEAIIPQLPPDLHNSLAERAAARILASLGDQQGLQNSLQKIQEMNQQQGTLLDDRVEGTPQKITARHSLLRYNKMGVRRRV
jgi:hypothetical protein